MGLLSLGTPLDWEETKKHADHVRRHGIEQLINIYKGNVDKERDVLLWGDEVEYFVVSYDHEKKEAYLSLRQNQILDELEKDEAEYRLRVPSGEVTA